MSDICKSEEIGEDCSDIELNGQSLEIKEKFCYLSDTIGAKEHAPDNDVTKISKWCKLRDLVPLLGSRCLPFRAKKADYILHV